MAATTIVVKISHGTDIRRFTTPSEDLTWATLVKRVGEAFSLVPDTFRVTYVDDENDRITLSSDEELSEAIGLARAALPPVLRLTVHLVDGVKEAGVAAKKASADADTNATNTTGTQSSSIPAVPTDLAPLFETLAKQLPAAVAKMPEVLRKMLPDLELDIDATVARNQAAAAAAADAARPATDPYCPVNPHEDNAQPGVHIGVTCDKSGMSPIVGNRYHLVGHNYDLCEAEYLKLPEREQRCFRKVPPPTNRPAEAAADLPPGAHPCAQAWAAAAAGGGCPWRGGPSGWRARAHGGMGRAAHEGPAPMGADAHPKPAARFVRDVTIFDGTQMAPGTHFTKIWRLKNVGDCPWPAGTKMLFVGGDQMTTDMMVPLSREMPVMPGEEVDVAVEMTAPPSLGRYLGYWRLTGPHGRRKFGQRVWCHVQVVDPTQELVPLAEHDLRATLDEIEARKKQALKANEDEAEEEADAAADVNAAIAAEADHDGSNLLNLCSTDGVVASTAGFTLETTANGTVLFVTPTGNLRCGPNGTLDFKGQRGPWAHWLRSDHDGATSFQNIGHQKQKGHAVFLSVTAAGQLVASSTPMALRLLAADAAAMSTTTDPKTANEGAVAAAEAAVVPSPKPPEPASVSGPATDMAAATDGADDCKDGASDDGVLVTEGMLIDAGVVAPAGPSGTPSPPSGIKGELMAMGFNDPTMLNAVIDKHGDDLEACARDLAAASEWDALLDDLAEMGFADMELNKTLLLKNSGNLKHTVRDLVEA